MTKKIYENPSMRVSLFEAENITTVSGYDTADAAVRGGAFTIDGNRSSEEVKVIFKF